MTTSALAVSCAARGLTLALACVAGAAWADPVAQMRQCRLLTDVALKAACYDAIVLPAPAGAATATMAAPAAAASATTATTVAAAAPRAAPAAATAAASFGLPTPAAAPANSAVVAGVLESRIGGLFEGWQPQSRIRLANGQVWQVTDGSEGVYTRRDPKVRISRGTLGSFFMQIEGVSQTPRVRRIQ